MTRLLQLLPNSGLEMYEAGGWLSSVLLSWIYTSGRNFCQAETELAGVVLQAELYAVWAAWQACATTWELT